MRSFWRHRANDGLDAAADYLCGTHAQHAALVARKSSTAASPSELMLYTTDDSAEMLAAAIHAGFFCFASEFRMKGRRLEARGLLNLELAGPNLEPSGEVPGGRIVLDLTPPPPAGWSSASARSRRSGRWAPAAATASAALRTD